MTEIMLNKKQISNLIKVLRQVKKLKYRKLEDSGYCLSWNQPVYRTSYKNEKLLAAIIQNDTIIYYDKKENRYDRILTGLILPDFQAIIGERSFVGLLDFLALCKKYKDEQVTFEITDEFLTCKVDQTIMKFKIIDPFEEEKNG